MGQYGTVQKRRFPDGVERLVWIKHMPRIPDEITSFIVYLYPSEKDAEQQTPAKGGSGFITSVPDSVPTNGIEHLYAVTNRHVIEQGATVIRICSTKQIFDLKKTDWHFDKAAPDLAVYPLGLAADNPLIHPLYRGHYLSANVVLQGLNIGAGDDVFMVGRYFPAERSKVSDPTVRFGNIALWPHRHIKHPLTKLPEASFLVEMRSQNGCSGSPVFVSVEGGSPRPLKEPWETSRKQWKITGMSAYFTTEERRVAFVGVDWGHLPDGSGTTLMALVVPEEELIKLLDSPELVEQRKEMKKHKENKTAEAVLDSNPDDEQPFSKDDFENALKRASRRIQPSPPDEGKSKT